MFNSGVIAASGVTSGYSADFTVGVFTDKFGTRRGFSADPNSTPAWQQQGSGVAHGQKYGGLDPIYVELGGTSYQIVNLSFFTNQQTLTILLPDQTSSTILPQDLFTSISTVLGSLNSADVTGHSLSSGYGNPNFKVTNWTWTASGGYTPPNIIGSTTTTRTLTIAE